MNFRIPYQIGRAHGEAGFIHVDVHTDGIGHSLVTNTIGVQAVEKALRDALDEIAKAIEQAEVIR